MSNESFLNWTTPGGLANTTTKPPVRRPQAHKALFTSVHIVLFFGILLSNSFILFLLRHVRNRKHYRVFDFIHWLCVADLGVALGAVFPVIFEEVSESRFHLPLPHITCPTTRFLYFFVTVASIAVRVAMTLDRVLFLRLPNPQLRFPWLSVRLMVFASFGIAALLSAPMLVIHDVREHKNQTICGLAEFGAEDEDVDDLSFHVIFYVVSVTFFGPVTIILASWTSITLTLLCQRRRALEAGQSRLERRSRPPSIRLRRLEGLTAGDRSSDGTTSCTRVSFASVHSTRLLATGPASPRLAVAEDGPSGWTEVVYESEPPTHLDLYRETLQRARRKATLMTVVTMVAYLVSWLPSSAIQLYIQSEEGAKWWKDVLKGQGWDFVALRLSMSFFELNSLINPWIYLCFSASLRQAAQSASASSETPHCSGQRPSRRQNPDKIRDPLTFLTCTL